MRRLVNRLAKLSKLRRHFWRTKAVSPIGRPVLRLDAAVLEEIRTSIGSMSAEQGGALGGDRRNGVITHFRFDGSARRTGATYSPDYDSLNRMFAEEWNPAGINLLGFVHSHPPGFRRPSEGDLVYAREILKGIPELTGLFLPIVVTEPDGGRFELLPFVAVQDGDDVRIDEAELLVVGGVEPGAAAGVLGEITASTDSDAGLKPMSELVNPESEVSLPAPAFGSAETFVRVGGAYDLGRLGHCRVVAVGVGGAAGFIEELARAGVGEFVLIDKDTVSESNIATQQVYRKDIGRPKVDCIAERLRDINPNVAVVVRQQWLEDIDDAAFRELAFGKLGDGEPAVTLLCGLTDNFEAQARVNRLALHHGLPSLCAQVYREGRGAEITFTYPGVTPACHRCALSGRYAAVLDEGYQNDVTSDSTPIFATTRLNALKGFIALALLHHEAQLGAETAEIADTGARRWVRLLERIGDRNLVQIRMDPDIATTIGLGVFDKVFCHADRERVVFDEAVWLPQKPDCPENGFPTCPDCGGTGDLRDAIGTFEGTHRMR
jgi:proteasome lid subunit RPN8/RPN11